MDHVPDTTPSDCYNAVCTGSSVDCFQDLAPGTQELPVDIQAH